jgi:hypothetical protein
MLTRSIYQFLCSFNSCNFFYHIRMFRRKPNSPTSPTTLTFADILSDLSRLQSYHQTHIGEKIDVLEIIKTEDSIDDERTTQSNYSNK